MNTAQEETLEDVMKRIMIRRNSVWSNKLASFEMSPDLLKHRVNARCICDRCSDTRPQPPVPGISMRAKRETPPRPEACGNPPRRRTPNTMNAPMETPDFEGHIPFALRVLNGPNRHPSRTKRNWL